MLGLLDTPRDVTVHGRCDPRFERVRQAFAANFADRGEIGASFCAYLGQDKVVDLWAGWADVASETPWAEDTIGVLFSATKGLLATCLLILADRGTLDLDEPVATYWPGFAASGKGDITVRTLLNHQAGLVGLDHPVTLEDFENDAVVPHLEQQAPLWEPGTDQGYHGVTFGPYGAELLRRITGRTVGQFFREEVAEPLGADVHIGLPSEHDHRVATLYPVRKREVLTRVLPRLAWGRTTEGRIYRAALDRESATHKAFAHPAELGARGIDNFNDQRVRRLELAWANGMGNARSLATVYAALANGGALGGTRLVGEDTIRPLTWRQGWSERDRVICKPVGWSQGFIKEELKLFSPHIEAFGHPGAGGAVGMADPRAGLSFAYVMNRMDFHLRSPRCLALCHALYGSL